MIKKVGKNFFKAAAALIVSAGLFSACGNIADVTIDGSTDAGARSAGAGITLRAKAKTASTDRFQFRISGVSITGTETITFDIRPSSYSKASTITVRDGSNSNTKWLADADIYSLSSSTDSAGETWYRVSAKAKNSTSTLGFTIGGAAEAGAKVYIKNLKIGSSYVDIKTSNCKTWSQPSEVEFSVSQSDDNGGNNPVQPSDGKSAPRNDGNIKTVGFRYSEYGVDDEGYSEPSASEWKAHMNKFIDHVPGTKGTFIFIVSECSGNTKCKFRFSKPEGGVSGSKISYGSEDSLCEKFLKMCDDNDYDVWLQVEPGDNELPKIAETVLNKFKNHKCVQGFGVDIEWWYRFPGYEINGCDDQGTPISAKKTNELLNAVNEVSKKHNKNYTVFLKHFGLDWLPSASDIEGMKYGKNLILVSDNQGFYEKKGKDEPEKSRAKMIKRFGEWAAAFPNNKVMFQIGYIEKDKSKQYKNDERFWKYDPIGLANEIANAARKANKNDIGIIWVDFTMHEFLGRLK